MDYLTLPSPADIHLSRDAKRSIEVDNAGGGSAISEMFSIDLYVKAFMARKVLLEMEVDYWFRCKMVDFVCYIPRYPKDRMRSKASRIGVSVTRAMGYPVSTEYTYEQGLRLLKKKIYGLMIARNSVVKDQAFYKSILHVWCPTPEIAYMLRRAYHELKNELRNYSFSVKGVIVVHLTVCSAECIYSDTLE